jgi:hypothetical protein
MKRAKISIIMRMKSEKEEKEVDKKDMVEDCLLIYHK